jgi:aspartate kinase
MSLIIQKYGGTSVGSIERIKHVAENVIKTRQQGHRVIVVLSAMNGETNRLIDLMNEMSEHADPREYSVAVSTGEQVSIALLAMRLIDRGYHACSLNGQQAGIVTDNQLKKARILEVCGDRIEKLLAEGSIPIVAGFQGVDAHGNVSTLGRGGSDTTAVALAAALKADECQIYTDVAGVYTADPRVVVDARLLPRVTFEEMLEMASLGAKVLQKRAVEFAGKYHVNLRVLSSFEEGTGTLISFGDINIMEQPIVSGIAYNRSEAKLTIAGVPDMPGVASTIITSIAKANIDVDMIIQNIGQQKGSNTDFTFTVSRDEYAKAFSILEKVAEKLKAKHVFGDQKIAKVSLIGVGMRSHSGVASKMFEILASENINIQLIATSEIKISVVIEEKYLELAVRALHSGFGLDKEAREEFDPMIKKEHVN